MPRGNPGVPKTAEHRHNLSIARMGGPGYWTGKKMPASARLAMSLAGKKKRLTKEHRAKIGAALKGRVVTEATRAKLRDRRHSLETRKKMSAAQKGAKSSSWRGGISSVNERIRLSLEFRQWRAAVFQRDRYTCQKCGAKHQVGSRPELHPHHIKPFAKYLDLRFVVSNGLTLCKECHREVHRNGKGNL